MKVVLFEDHGVAQLHPITTGRCAFSITCGTLRVSDIADQLSSEVYALTRPYLEKLGQLRCPHWRIGVANLKAGLRQTAEDEPVLVLNGRMVPSVSTLAFLREICESEAPKKRETKSRGRKSKSPAGKGTVCTASHFGAWQNSLAFAYLPAGALLAALEAEPQDAALVDLSRRMQGAELDYTHPVELFDYPHDVTRTNMEIFSDNIAYRLSHVVPSRTGLGMPSTSGSWREIKPGVFVGQNVQLGDYIVTDTTEGPILIDDGASIGPFCYLKGPVYVGPYAKVIEHAALKEFVGLAHTTKVGGEVEASNIEPYTNKQHHGFLGHSYLGSWINLGAGTCNSDLKNTYGTISMNYADGRVATSLQFLGCIIGDYAKTAINTSIFTGKVIGCCSMVYGFVARDVPSFVNYARSFGQCTEISVEVMTATQQRMFARRNVTQTPEHIELLHHMFELTKEERQMENEPLSL